MIETVSVDLPWPPSALKPNGSHGHWAKKSSAAKAYRITCAWACREAGLVPTGIDRAHLTIRFHAPDKRRRDLDNMLATIKCGLDAVSEAIGVDDSKFGLTILRGEPIKGGRVVISIEGASV